MGANGGGVEDNVDDGGVDDDVEDNYDGVVDDVEDNYDGVDDDVHEEKLYPLPLLPPWAAPVGLVAPQKL